MKNLIGLLLAALVGSFVFTGYQCSSPEMTGAKVYIQQKNYDKAIENLEIEVKKNPGNEEAWYLLGRLKGEKGDYVGMNYAFDQCLKVSDKNARDIHVMRYSIWGQHVNSGVNYLERASSDSAVFFEKTLAEFRQAIQAWPDTSLTYRYLGYAYNNKGDMDSALIALKTAWVKGKDVDALRRIGRIYLQKGYDHKNKFDGDNGVKVKAVKDLAQLQKGMHQNDVMNTFGAPDERKRKGPKREDWIYNAYKLVVTIDGDRVAGKKFEAPYNPRIDSTEYYAAQREFAAAIDYLEMVKKADPKDKDNLGFLLKAYVEANRITEARLAWKQAVELDPNDKTNHYILAILYRTEGDYGSAVKEFKEALAIDPNYGEALFDLGATYYNWGVDILKEAEAKGKETEEYKEKFKEALPYMEKSSELKKEDAQVWETLGTIYARLGNKDKAMKAFDQADKIRKGN